MSDEHDPGVQSFEIEVNGQVLTEDEYDLVIDARVSTSLHGADRLNLRLRDPFFELLDAGRFPYDATIDLSFPDSVGAMTLVFTGSVVGLEIEQGGSNRHELVVVALDDRHVLGRSGQIRTFVDRSVSDIVKTVASDAGLTAVVGAFNTQFANLVQSGSDFEFLNRLASWADAQWWVDDKQKLQFQPARKGGTAVKMTWGENLQNFSTRTSSAGRPGEVTVRAWDEATQKAVVASKSAKDVPDPGVTAPLATDANKAALTGTRIIGTAPFADMAEGTSLATSLMKTATSGVVVMKGESLGAPTLRAGGKVKLDQVGTKLGGDWLATEVEHLIGVDRPFTTRFVCGGREGSALIDLMRGSSGDAIGPTRLMEPAIGTVSNTTDPDKHGRVKVKFPTLGDDVESPWARVASLGAGKARGLVITPQIDDEVLVMFEHGSWRRPIVIGGLWSTKKTPPPHDELIDGGKADKAIVLQTVGGHVIELHEGSGGESFISLLLASGATELRLADDKVTLKSDKPIEVTSDKNITIESKGGDISMKANNIKIEAKQNVDVKGLQATVDAKAALALKAGSTADLKGNGPVTVQSSAITSVKGSLLKLN